MDRKDILDTGKMVKEHMQFLMEWGTSKQPRQDHIWIGAGEPNNRPTNEGKPCNGKLIGRLLVTVTLADPERFTPKGKPITYTEVFVELYNWKNRGQVYKIYGMVELEKIRALTAENLCKLGAHRIIEISLILRIAHVVLRDQDKFVFYGNNYIDWNFFNQLYDPNQIIKSIRNADAVACKLRPVLTRATNHRLEVARKKQPKREKIVERQKTEAMAAKHGKDRRRISLSSGEEGNHESDTEDDTHPDQAKDKYPFQL